MNFERCYPFYCALTDGMEEGSVPTCRNLGSRHQECVHECNVGDSGEIGKGLP